MQWLLNLLNGDFLSGAASPTSDHLSVAQQDKVKSWIAEDIAKGRITQEQAVAALRDHRDVVMDATEQAEATRLRALMVHHLTPVLGLDPHDLVMQRRKTMEALLRNAKRKGRTTEARELRQQLAEELQSREAIQQHEREEGLYAIVSWLSEWAQGERLYPWWQIEPVSDDELKGSRPPAEQYRIGAKAFTVTQWSGRPNTLAAKGMMNLGACLVSGEINRLRVCNLEACKRFFYAEDIRSESCSDECARQRDAPRAVERMKRWRKKRDAADRALFLATPPKLQMRTLRALEKQGMLNEAQIDRLDGLREKLEEGMNPEQIWAQSNPRTRALLKKVRKAGAI